MLPARFPHHLGGVLQRVGEGLGTGRDGGQEQEAGVGLRAGELGDRCSPEQR
jgi:hypothetical protein